MDKPQAKFKPGDTVRIKDLPESELRKQSHGWNEDMNNYIGKNLTIATAHYAINTKPEDNGRDEYVWIYTIRENNWTYEEYVFTPHINNNQLIWI
jgi:hypothetical protein